MKYVIINDEISSLLRGTAWTIANNGTAMLISAYYADIDIATMQKKV